MFEDGSLHRWVTKLEDFLRPSKTVWIDGSEEQLETLRQEACHSGVLVKLNQEKLPGCYLHRSAWNDVARVEDRTFICSRLEEDAGPTNNWMSPSEGYRLMYDIAGCSYNGKTMYVIPFAMGPLDSPLCRVGVEITDSIYVVLNMAILARVGFDVLKKLRKSENWVRGIHCSCNLDESKRYICHFPEDNTIISVNSAYGGNALLGKKCFALRIASYLGKDTGRAGPKALRPAEHMLILGIKAPEKEVKYIAAAFPSACGKTNLAMLIPPEIYKQKGYEVFCVGDDIAWLHIGRDGRLWAINPENGFFGVAPGTNENSNANALACTKTNTIFTNVVQNLDDNTVWWEGLDSPAPENALDWKGQPWNGKRDIHSGAHPNSRFTSPAQNCPSLSPEFESPYGVPISAIVFGGRRAKLTPLVCEARNWTHGVFLGATMASETTSAASGKVGVIRRDPMAMVPFCGYNMGEYFGHWIKLGEVLGKNAPKIFHVNWFRQDESGKFLWPGFKDNMRVLDWILQRCDNNLTAAETAIGFVPFVKDINTCGLDITQQDLLDLLKVDKHLWQDEAINIETFFKKFDTESSYKLFKKTLPEELQDELAELKARLK